MFLPWQSFAQDWALKKDEWGIQVHMRPVENSKVKQARAKCLIKAKAQEIIDILYDFENYSLWFDECSSSRLVKKVGNNSYVIHLIFNLPFPFQDRDIVTRLDFEHQADGSLIINTQNQPDFIPKKKGLHRVKSFDTKMIVQVASSESAEITTYLHAEMGKMVPLMAVNDAMLWGPYLSVEKIRRLAEGYYDVNQGF